MTMMIVIVVHCLGERQHEVLSSPIAITKLEVSYSGLWDLLYIVANITLASTKLTHAQEEINYIGTGKVVNKNDSTVLSWNLYASDTMVIDILCMTILCCHGTCSYLLGNKGAHLYHGNPGETRGVRITLVRGRIQLEQVDVIACAVDNSLNLATSGAAVRALLATGGNILQNDCRKLFPSGIKFGDIIAINGGKLKCKKVYLGSLPDVEIEKKETNKDGNKHPHTKNEVIALRSIIFKMLNKAINEQVRCIALPAIGTSKTSLAHDKVANIMFDCVGHLPIGTLSEVRFVLNDKATYLAFEKYFRSRVIAVWPPAEEILLQMHDDEVTKCNITSPRFIGPYYNTNIYDMSSKNRGRVIIIHNMYYKRVPIDHSRFLGTRRGSEKDCDSLQRVFHQLHFTVNVYKEMTGKEMQELAERESKHKDHQSAKCFVFIVLGYGNEDGVFGVDGTIVKVQDLALPFDSLNCQHLTGKPKIFIFDGDRGAGRMSSSSGPATTPVSFIIPGTLDKRDDTRVQELVQNSSSHTFTAMNKTGFPTYCQDGLSTGAGTSPVIVTEGDCSKADFLFAYATIKGYAAYRHIYKGSWFIQALVWKLKYESHQEHLTDILTQVNRLVSISKAKQRDLNYTTVSNFESSLTKKLYFFPGVYDYPPKEIN